MTDIMKSDFYRVKNSRLFYGFAMFTALIAFSLMMLIRQDIRLGISIFGNLTAFRMNSDIIRMGMEYQKGVGVFVAILLSVFIGQEYQWKTWQHKWITKKSRTSIYLSKAVFSSALSALLFWVYEVVALLSSDQIQDVLTGGYAATMICGLFLYAALGSVICLLSMLIKNSTAATIVCLCYVLLGETISSLLRNVSNLSSAVGPFIELAIKHSVYGMSTLVCESAFAPEYTIIIVINSLAIMLVSTAFGIIVFRKYEL